MFQNRSQKKSQSCVPLRLSCLSQVGRCHAVLKRPHGHGGEAEVQTEKAIQQSQARQAVRWVGVVLHLVTATRCQLLCPRAGDCWPGWGAFAYLSKWPKETVRWINREISGEVGRERFGSGFNWVCESGSRKAKITHKKGKSDKYWMFSLGG
jgi:hypothetical protein